jgi:hypothetical protein
LFAYIHQLEDQPGDASTLDSRLARPVFIEGTTPITWNLRGDKNLSDLQKREDLKALIMKFTLQTGNFYSTRTKVSQP